MPVFLVGHASRADVDVARRVRLRELQLHLREVGGVQQQLCAPQLLVVDVGGQVVAFDYAVHGFELGERLQLDVRREVARQLLEKVFLVGEGLDQVGFELFAHRLLDSLELGVRLAQVSLLFVEDRVVLSTRVHDCLSVAFHAVCVKT